MTTIAIQVNDNVRKIERYAKSIASKLLKRDDFDPSWSCFELLSESEWRELVDEAKKRDADGYEKAFEVWKEQQHDRDTEAFMRYGEIWFLAAKVDEFTE